MERLKNGKMEKFKARSASLSLSFFICHLSTNGHRLSRRKDVNIEIMKDLNIISA